MKENEQEEDLQVAPFSMPEAITQMCGTCANENAYKTAFIAYMVRNDLILPLSASPMQLVIDRCFGHS